MDNVRTSVVKLFLIRLNASPIFNGKPELYSKIASDIEAACINKSIAATHSSTLSYHENVNCHNYYYQLTTEVLTNMDTHKQMFFEKLASGEINASQVPDLDPAEFNPAPMEKYIKTLELQDKAKVILKTNDHYLCPNCKKPCVTMSVQKGRADEQSNTIVSCPHCGKQVMY